MNASDRYDSLFQYYASVYSIPDWHLLKAQVKQESQFDPMARSQAGACGLAQFVAATFDEWSFRLGIKAANPYNPEHSIHCQAAYMRWLLDNFSNNYDMALGAYNFGIGNIKTNKPWPNETQHYVKLIKQYYRDYCGKDLIAV